MKIPGLNTKIIFLFLIIIILLTGIVVTYTIIKDEKEAVIVQKINKAAEKIYSKNINLNVITTSPVPTKAISPTLGTWKPIIKPSPAPTLLAENLPSPTDIFIVPSMKISQVPTVFVNPTSKPTVKPTVKLTTIPTNRPTVKPTSKPTTVPTITTTKTKTTPSPTRIKNLLVAGSLNYPLIAVIVTGIIITVSFIF